MTRAQFEAEPPGWARPPTRALERQRTKREKIIGVAMEQFAESGYEGARVEAIAAGAGVSKGAVFSYFTSKAGLFLAAYEAAAGSFSRYLDAPDEVLERGFFAVIRYWLELTPHLISEDWIAYRVTLLGNYCSDLQLKHWINQYLVREDPYGTRAFVRYGLDRGEVRTDVDSALVVSVVDWLMDRCQDAMLTEELDPGLFGLADERGGQSEPGESAQSAEARETRVQQFVEMLRGAVGTR